MLDAAVRSVIDPHKLVQAPPSASVQEAAASMKERGVGAVLVIDEGRLVGIFTERDVVYRVVAAGRDPAATRLAEVMTADPKTVAPEETFGYALLLMHEQGFRHAPVVKDGAVVGIVSARQALDPDLEEFSVEAYRRDKLRRRATGR